MLNYISLFLRFNGDFGVAGVIACVLGLIMGIARIITDSKNSDK